MPEPEPEPIPPPPPPAPADVGGDGLCAVVLYDYDAAEDNEMNLVEGELIEQVEEIDEGWWSGIGPGGKSGLFPANYVELIEGAPQQEPEPEPEPEEAPPPPPPPPVSLLIVYAD
ncbi:SH3 domain-containing protein [Mycena sp. CBHHK59/15]|nr:SH3 domain-containing protein [Mycena sp. CBHHK59/15]